MDADPPQLDDHLEPFRVSVNQILTTVNKVLNSFSSSSSYSSSSISIPIYLSIYPCFSLFFKLEVGLAAATVIYFEYFFPSP